MLDHNNLKQLLADYIRDFEFVNVVPVLRKEGMTVPPTKAEALSNAHHVCISLLEISNMIDGPFYHKEVLASLTFIQGTLWVIGFYSHEKIMNDIEKLQG